MHELSPLIEGRGDPIWTRVSNLVKSYQLMAKTWFTVALYSLISLFLWQLCGASIQDRLSPVVSRMSSNGIDGALWCIAGLLLTGWALWGKGRLLGWSGLRAPLTAPAPLIPALVASFLYLCFRRDPALKEVGVLLEFAITESSLWPKIAVASLISLPFVSLLWEHANRQRQASAYSDELKAKSEPEALQDLLEWLQDDREITRVSEDRFGHAPIARRMASRIVTTKEPPTMALVGPQGSGKSSVRGMVERILSEHSHVQVVQVSLWPFESSEAAVSGILKALSARLSQYVSKVSLAGISEDYLAAVEKATGVAGAFARVLRGPSSAEEVVKRIGEAAQRADLCVVLWIEDLERFDPGQKTHTGQGASHAGDGERVGPVRALLHLLDQQKGVCLVLASTSIESRLDIGKLARFIEVLPELEPSVAFELVHRFRKECLSGYPARVINPASPACQELLRPQNYSHPWVAAALDSSDRVDVPMGIATLLRSPRRLKMALRGAQDSWEKLCGEIDFDSLLIASTLRVAVPAVFDLLVSHAASYRVGDHGTQRPNGQLSLPEQAMFNALTELRPIESRAVRKLVEHIFPYAVLQEASGPEYDPASNPQGFGFRQHADYWQRYLSQDAKANGRSDQDTLRAIRDWRDGASNRLVELSMDHAFAVHVAVFERQLGINDLVRLTEEVTAMLLGCSASEWIEGSRPPTVITLVQIIQERGSGKPEIVRQVAGLVRRAAKVHLPIGYWIAHYMQKGKAVDEAGQNPCAEALHNAIRDICEHSDASARLLHALKDGSPWLLRWVARLCQWMDDEGGVLRFTKEWAMVSRAILGCAEVSPDVGVPIIATFVARTNMTLPRGAEDTRSVNERWSGEVESGRIAELFSIERVRTSVTKFQGQLSLDAQAQAALDALLAWAKSG